MCCSSGPYVPTWSAFSLHMKVSLCIFYIICSRFLDLIRKRNREKLCFVCVCVFFSLHLSGSRSPWRALNSSYAHDSL